MLSTCRPDAAVAWARRGLGPLTVVSMQGWTLVAPAGPPRARPPYDDPVRTLAGRPVGLRMRPAMGFFQVGRQAVITVHSHRWRAVQRWAVWTPRDALVQMAGFAPARPVDMVRVAGAGGRALDAPTAIRGLRDLMHRGDLDAGAVLTQALELLGLPGATLLTGAQSAADLPGARVVAPKDRHARAFDQVVAERLRRREESEA